MKHILFVCHGNICRSPMAEFVFLDLLKKHGLESRFSVGSAATSTEELGNPVHHGTREILRRNGIFCGEHRAVQLKRSDYARYDLIIGMDEMNRRNILRILGADPDNKVCLLLDFSDKPRNIADPWYTGDFTQSFADITEGCIALLNYVTQQI